MRAGPNKNRCHCSGTMGTQDLDQAAASSGKPDIHSDRSNPEASWPADYDIYVLSATPVSGR